MPEWTSVPVVYSTLLIMVAITVSPQGRPSFTLEFPSKSHDSLTIAEIKTAIHKRIPKVSQDPCARGTIIDGNPLQLVANRQRLTLPATGGDKPKPLTDESKTLSAYGVQQGDSLRLKDLGQQVDYRVLYLWEYVSS
jgi:very-long-chain enoyl-CoA reductase